MGNTPSFQWPWFQKRWKTTENIVPEPEVETPISPAFENRRIIAHRQLGINTDVDYNIGFCGVTSCGKSALINALRGKKHSDAESAISGFGETTMEIQKYHFAEEEMKHLVLWDIPGLGTITFPSATYFERQMLFAFDFLVIICSNFGEDERKLAFDARAADVPFAFVKTKCDTNLRDDYESNDIPVTDQIKADFVRTAKEHFQKNFAEFTEPLFLVSKNVFLNQPDFQKYKLQEEMLVNFILDTIIPSRMKLPETITHCMPIAMQSNGLQDDAKQYAFDCAMEALEKFKNETSHLKFGGLVACYMKEKFEKKFNTKMGKSEWFCFELDLLATCIEHHSLNFLYFSIDRKGTRTRFVLYLVDSAMPSTSDSVIPSIVSTVPSTIDSNPTRAFKTMRI